MEPRARGQSLIEVLVAMAIAAGALVTAGAVFAQAGGLIAGAGSATIAIAEARARLEEFLGQPAAALIAAGAVESAVPALPSGSAAARFEALGEPGIPDPPVRITVTVSFVHRGSVRRMTLRTVRF